MEFKTKAALAEWANDQTMAEIEAYYNGLPGVKPVKKFESRDMAVTRIWTAVSRDKPTWRGSLRRAARGNSPRLGRLRNPVADLMLTPSEIARMGSMMG